MKVTHCAQNFLCLIAQHPPHDPANVGTHVLLQMGKLKLRKGTGRQAYKDVPMDPCLLVILSLCNPLPSFLMDRIQQK